MLTNQYLLYLITVGLLLVKTEPLIAQSISHGSANIDGMNAQVYFKPPPDDKKPDKTLGAGSRQGGQCPQDSTPVTTADTLSNKPPLMALIPTANYGLTLAERPTFLVYVPKTSAKQVVLSLREEGTLHHSQTLLPITETPGVISVKPSDNSPPLKVGKNYQWALVLVCGERPGPNDPAIASWVKRVAPLQPQLNLKTALEQAKWYGEQGIWYDAVAALAQARQSQLHNNAMKGIWVDFLKSTGLGAIATEPLQF